MNDKISALVSPFGPLGIFLDRSSARIISQRLSKSIYPRTVKPYASDESGEKWLAESIEFDLHVWMNQLNVPHLYCKHCGETEQYHCTVGYWCRTEQRKFEAK